MWSEDYRPREFCDVMGHESVIQNLITVLKYGNKNIQNMLLLGASSVGKTTILKCIIKEYYDDTHFDSVLMLNASDDRGINTMRTKIKTFVSTKSYNKHRKLVIFDDIENMSTDTQFALRRIIESYADNARFIMTTSVLNRIIPSLYSRCIILRLHSMTPRNIKPLLIKHSLEYVANDPILFEEITDLLKCDIRRILTFLQLYSYKSSISKDDLYHFVFNISYADYSTLQNHLLSNEKDPRVFLDFFTSIQINVSQILHICFHALNNLKSNINRISLLSEVEDKYTTVNHIGSKMFIYEICLILALDSSFKS